MDHGMICSTSKMVVEQGVAGGAETWPEMLLHHHHTPVRGWWLSNACSATFGDAFGGGANMSATDPTSMTPLTDRESTVIPHPAVIDQSEGDAA